MTMSSAPDISSANLSIPKHVAVIMDGNNRWAKKRNLAHFEGHREGERALRLTVEAAANAGISVLTVFAFSSENWRRPADEVAALMDLFKRAIDVKVPQLQANGIRLRFMGDLSRFSPELREGMLAAERSTIDSPRMTLVIAVNYGGQWDMANAAQQLCQQVEAGRLKSADVTPDVFAQYLQLADLPPVDLLIRTGGEKRISNFLLWQAAYAEYFFSDILWPDFNADSLNEALQDYQSRQRRFGRTSEQIEAM